MQSNRDQYGWNPDARESWLVGLFRDAWDQVSELFGTLALGVLYAVAILAVLVIVGWFAYAVICFSTGRPICSKCYRPMGQDTPVEGLPVMAYACKKHGTWIPHTEATGDPDAAGLEEHKRAGLNPHE